MPPVSSFKPIVVESIMAESRELDYFGMSFASPLAKPQVGNKVHGRIIQYTRDWAPKRFIQKYNDALGYSCCRHLNGHPTSSNSSGCVFCDQYYDWTFGSNAGPAYVSSTRFLQLSNHPLGGYSFKASFKCCINKSCAQRGSEWTWCSRESN